jgi:hypothetical protein
MPRKPARVVGLDADHDPQRRRRVALVVLDAARVELPELSIEDRQAEDRDLSTGSRASSVQQDPMRGLAGPLQPQPRDAIRRSSSTRRRQ